MKIVKTSKQVLLGLSDEQINIVKDSLTFDNPAYKSAKRYSRYNHVSIPPYLEYYKEGVYTDRETLETCRELTVPIGFNVCEVLECREPEVVDLRVSKEVKYPPFVLELREDQEKAKQSYLKSVKQNNPKCILQLPTGKGKSILALNLAFTLKQKTLILVHKDDLVVGWQKDIELSFGGVLNSGLIKAKKKIIGEQITIATVQTLGRMNEEELCEYTSQFGLVIQDECHHIGINMFNVIDSFSSFYKMGLSATPKRTDGLNFTFDLFLGGLCYKHIITKDDKDICQVRVIRKDTKAIYKPFLYEGMIHNLYDFKEDELPSEYSLLEDIPYKDRPTIPYVEIDNAVVLNLKYKIQVCKDVLYHYKKGNSCLLLFQFKEQVREYYQYLSRYVPKETLLLYYGDNKESSQSLMEKAESKECLITLATLAKTSEGTNVKSWEVEFLVSSMNNEKNVEQATGRIRRSKKDKMNPVLVYDYRCPEVYSFKSHGYTRDRVYKNLKYELEGDEAKKRSKFSRGYTK